MQPIRCAGNFFTGLKVGKFRIVAVSAVVDTVTANARLGLIDDKNLGLNPTQGLVRDADYDVQTCEIDIKGVASVDGTLTFYPNEPITIINGTSIVHSDNIVAGTIKVYER
jgi:hypothetical protein